MDDLELLIRYRDGDLTRAETDAVEARLRSEPRLRGRLEGLQAVAEALEQGATPSFRPFFSTRVMARIRSEAVEPAEAMYDALRWVFARLAAASVVVMLGIGAYSAIEGGHAASVVDSMLGLPEATLASAVTLVD